MKRKRFKKLARALCDRTAEPDEKNEAYLMIRDFKIMPDEKPSYWMFWEFMIIAHGNRGVGVKRK